MTDMDVLEACEAKKLAGQVFNEKLALKQQKNTEFNMFNLNRTILLSLGNVERVNGGKP